MQSLLRISLVVGVASFSFTPVSATADTFTMTAHSGVPTLVKVFASWNADCIYRVFDVKVLSRPSHGIVTPKIISHVIGQQEGQLPQPLRGGSYGQCLGRKIKSMAVWYTSERRFHGTDSFTIERPLLSVGARVSETYTINVE